MTQNEAILKHLKKRPITPLQALNLYGCFRLAARISNLRSQGFEIQTKTVSKNGKTFAKYCLKN